MIKGLHSKLLITQEPETAMNTSTSYFCEYRSRTIFLQVANIHVSHMAKERNSFHYLLPLRRCYNLIRMTFW